MMKRASLKDLAHAVKTTAWLLDCQDARWCSGAVVFRLEAGWALAISPDDAERLRVDVCRSGRTRATMWVCAGDDYRLAELVAAAEAEATALVA